MRMLAEDELRDAVLLIFANKQVWTIKCLFYSILLYYIKIASLTMYLYLLPVSKSCAFPRYLSFCLPVLSLRLSYSLMCFSPLLSFRPYLTSCVGPAQCHECSRDHRQAGAPLPPSPQLVHPGHLRHQRRRSIRGPRLAGQSAEEQEVSGPIRGE